MVAVGCAERRDALVLRQPVRRHHAERPVAQPHERFAAARGGEQRRQVGDDALVVDAAMQLEPVDARANVERHAAGRADRFDPRPRRATLRRRAPTPGPAVRWRQSPFACGPTASPPGHGRRAIAGAATACRSASRSRRHARRRSRSKSTGCVDQASTSQPPYPNTTFASSRSADIPSPGYAGTGREIRTTGRGRTEPVSTRRSSGHSTRVRSDVASVSTSAAASDGGTVTSPRSSSPAIQRSAPPGSNAANCGRPDGASGRQRISALVRNIASA